MTAAPASVALQPLRPCPTTSLHNNAAIFVCSPGFAALRDGTPSTDPNIEGRRALFKDIFAHLSGSGVEQKSLQLAWDFTVGTTKSLTERMVAARDDAMSRLATSACCTPVHPTSRCPNGSRTTLASLG